MHLPGLRRLSCWLRRPRGHDMPITVAGQRMGEEPLLLSVEERLHSREAEGRYQLRMVMREHGRMTAVARSPRDGGELDRRDRGSESDLLVRKRIVGLG